MCLSYPKGPAGLFREEHSRASESKTSKALLSVRIAGIIVVGDREQGVTTAWGLYCGLQDMERRGINLTGPLLDSLSMRSP